MFSGCLQDFSRMFSGCSDGSCGPYAIWWSFQMKEWTLMIQRNSMIPNYLMIPAIRWSPATRWSIGSMDFDNPKVYGDTSITDGLVYSYLYLLNGPNFRVFQVDELFQISFAGLKSCGGIAVESVLSVRLMILPIPKLDWFGGFSLQYNIKILSF